MTCRVHASGGIDMFHYGELSPAERASVEAHLRTCGECRHALEELAVITAALASRPDVAAPPGDDWSAFMARLEVATGAPGQRAQAGPRLLPFLAMAAIVALATAAVLLTWRTSEVRSESAGAPRTATVPDRGSSPHVRSGEVAESARESAALPARLLDAALLDVSDQHFERSKLVVLGLATKDPATADGNDWAHERQLATSLLNDTRLYRQAAEERGMEPLTAVLGDLELVLLQTVMAEERDAASLERLQRLIRRRDLLTKMNIVHAGGR